MPTYFGITSIGANSFGRNEEFWIRCKNYVTGFTCPGTGSQTIKELSAYVKANTTGKYFRAAIYDTSHNLIAQGASALELSTTAGWQGHTTQSSITPNPATLTGGTQYEIAFSIQTPCGMYYDSGSNGDFTYGVADYYTGGFPSTLADDLAAMDLRPSMRCGVDPTITHYTLTAGGGSFSETGQTATLRAARKMAALTASFSLSGQVAALRASRKIAAGTGSFSETGQTAALRAIRKILSGTGSFSLTGQVAALRAARKIAAGTGAFLLTGFDVSYIPPTNVKIVGINAIDGKLIYLIGKLYET